MKINSKIIIFDFHRDFVGEEGTLIKILSEDQVLCLVNNEEIIFSNKDVYSQDFIEKQIPKGPYCYAILNIKDAGKSISVKRCPYFQWRENNATCSLLEISENDYFELSDSVKCCGFQED